MELFVSQVRTHKVLAYVLAYTGLRWGEATGLRVRSVDLDRHRLWIEENAVMVGGEVHIGSTKSDEARGVPYPLFLHEDITRLCAGRSPDMILFGNGISHLKLPHSQSGWFAQAVLRCQAIDPTFLRITPHDLRHTAASLAVSAGANVKAIQRMLGHASAAMTLDTYADLFEDDLDVVSLRLDEMRQKTLVGLL